MIDVTIPLCFTAGEDEPRVRDLDLADRLGMSRPRYIRSNIIKPNLELLGELGEVRVLRTHSQDSMGYRYKDATEYFLNEGQAVWVALRSDTPKAKVVQIAVIKAYLEWRRGTASLRAEFAALRTEMAELRTIRDGRTACRTGMTIYEFAERHSIERTGRGRQIPKMRAHLLRWCKARGVRWELHEMHIFRPFEEVFPIEQMDRWWRDYQAWQAKRKAKAAGKLPGGQTVIPFTS